MVSSTYLIIAQIPPSGLFDAQSHLVQLLFAFTVSTLIPLMERMEPNDISQYFIFTICVIVSYF